MDNETTCSQFDKLEKELNKYFAVDKWVSQLYQIPYNVMKMLICSDDEEFIDVTYPQTGEYVEVISDETSEETDSFKELMVVKYVPNSDNPKGQEYYVMDEKTGNVVKMPYERILKYKHDEDMIAGPWVFTNRFDQEWIANNVRDISNLGFMVMKSNEFGYVLALKQDVNDRTEKLWTPLYDLRGLRWHL